MLVTPITDPETSTVTACYIPTHHPVHSESSEYSYESTDFTRPCNSSHNHQPSRHSRDEEVFDEADEAEEAVEAPRVKERFLSSTLQRNPKSSKRMSSMELEKLFRFKSELQLNLSKKVRRKTNELID